MMAPPFWDVEIPALLWPLSQESLPTWTAIVVVLVSFFAKAFVIRKMPKDQYSADEKKRIYLLRVMEAQLDYVANKDEEAALQPAEHEDDVFGPEGLPEASHVLSLVWDDIHDIPTTAYGISATDHRLVKTKALLKRLAAAELQKAVHMTRKAGHIARGNEAATKNLEEIMRYWSGEKLREIAGFQKDELLKHLGPDFVDKTKLKEAEAYLKEVQKMQGKHMNKLLGLISPHVPILVFCGILLILQTIFQTVFHQIGYWMTPVEMAMAGDWHGMRLRLAQIFFGHVIFDVLNTVREAFQDRASAELHASVTQGVLRSLLQQDYEYFDRTPAGVLQERLSHDAGQLGHNLIGFPQTIISCSIRVIFSLMIAYQQTPTDIFLMAVAPLGPIMVLQYFVVKFWQRMDKKIRKLQENSASSTSETLREIKTVRQFAMESKEADKYNFNSSRCQLLTQQVSTSHRIMGMLFGLSVYGGLVFTVWLGAYRVFAGEMTMATLMDLTFKLNFNVVHTLRHLIEELPRFNRLMQPLGRISELLESSPKIEPTSGEVSGLKPTKFHGLIEFDNVHFAYPKDPRKQILKGLTFTVEPGQKVALIGSTGCGKSSTMSLLQRLYDPQQGSIRIDGKDLKDYDLRYLRSRIVIVDQFTVLFACSVRDNITYGLESVSDEEVEQACREAAAWDFLQEKPDKLMTSVAVGGTNFSGGQRQRIAIARAIVRKPDVILLDEATASLDAENEKLVQQALDKLAKKGSALVIAHRLSTIKDSDKIVVMDKGVKVEEGAHDQLLRSVESNTWHETGDADTSKPVPCPFEAVKSNSAGSPAEELNTWLAEKFGMPEPSLADQPPPLDMKRADTFHGVTVAPAEKDHVTYKKLWDVSDSSQEKMTLSQMQQKIVKIELELCELKSRASAIRAHTAQVPELPKVRSLCMEPEGRAIQDAKDVPSMPPVVLSLSRDNSSASMGGA